MRQLDQQINLYQRAAKRKVAAFSSRTTLIFLAVVVAGMLSIQLYGYFRLKLDEKRYANDGKQIQMLLAQIKELDAAHKPGENQLLKSRLLKLTQLINNNKKVFDRMRLMMQDKRVFVSDYLEGLGKATPEGVWLTGIVANAAGNVELRGSAMSPAQVPLMIQSLASVEAFRGLTFETVEVTKSKEQDKEYISFAVSSGGLDEGTK